MQICIPHFRIHAHAVAVLLCLSVSAAAQSAKQPALNTNDIAEFLKKTDEVPGTHAWTSAMVQKLAQCWAIPPGAREVNIPVKVHFILGPDARVARQPKVLNESSKPLFAATAQSAISAIIECQPYDFLPPDKFEIWKDNILEFNPNMLFGN